jgi:hypothetical protein
MTTCAPTCAMRCVAANLRDTTSRAAHQEVSANQCDAVRYAISGSPEVVYACHCTDCQRQSGSAFAMAAVIPQKHFRVTQGAPEMFARVTGPTKTMECWFCPACHMPGGTSYPNRNVQPGTRGWFRPSISGRAVRRNGSPSRIMRYAITPNPRPFPGCRPAFDEYGPA